MTELDAGAFLATLAPGRPVPIDARAFGDLWAAVDPTPARVARALAVAGVVVDVDEAIEVLIVVRELAHELMERQAIFDATAEQTFEVWLDSMVDDRRGLVLDPKLGPQLPLLELAHDIAHCLTGGRLTVAAVRPGDSIDGLFAPGRELGAIILLDPESPTLEETFAHELSHPLDPELATVNSDGREAFAEALAPLLLEHEPTTIAEAQPLVARVLEEVGPFRRPVPGPTSSVHHVLVWALGEALGRHPELELVAAHSAPQPPDVNATRASTAGARRGEGGHYGASPRPGAACVSGAAGHGDDRITEEND